MKKIIQNLLILAAFCGLSASASAQSTMLYAGYKYSDQLAVIDTAGGTYTVLEYRTLTSDAGTVNGCFGLSLRVSTGEMYVIYNAEGGAERNLGILDTLSGLITDIGLAGNLTDITFANDVLYGTTGSYYGTYQFVEVDLTDASLSNIFAHASDNYGPAIGYDHFNGNILKFDRDNYTSIDGLGLTETIIAATGHPGECHAVAMLSPSMALVANYGTFYEFDLITNEFIAVLPFDDNVHALAFGKLGLAIIANGPTTFCSNEPTELSLTDEGETYQWALDGTDIGGAIEAIYTPEASGSYTCMVDDEETNGLTITIIPAPEASFTANPNPVILADDPTGTVDFTNTSIGGDDYHWDFDNGFTTALENPSFSFTIVGTYDVILWVTDTETGCSDSTVVTIVVSEELSLGELSLNKVTIFPIPSNDFVTLNFNGLTGIYNGQLLDASGKIIESKTIDASENTIFDIQTLETGLYFIKVSNESAERYFRVVKN